MNRNKSYMNSMRIKTILLIIFLVCVLFGIGGYFYISLQEMQKSKVLSEIFSVSTYENKTIVGNNGLQAKILHTGLVEGVPFLEFEIKNIGRDTLELLFAYDPLLIDFTNNGKTYYKMQYPHIWPHPPWLKPGEELRATAYLPLNGRYYFHFNTKVNNEILSTSFNVLIQNIEEPQKITTEEITLNSEKYQGKVILIVGNLTATELILQVPGPNWVVKITDDNGSIDVSGDWGFTGEGIFIVKVTAPNEVKILCQLKNL